MSITTEDNRTEELTTDGVETEFDFDMLIHHKSWLQVWYEVTDGNYVQLTLDTHYTVVFTEDGGTVTTIGGSSPYAAGKLLIIRRPPLTMQTNWLYNDNHTEQTHQDDFDHRSAVDIWIQEQLDRCVGFAIHSGTSGIEYPEPEADKIIGWNNAGTALENKIIIPISGLITFTPGSVLFADANGVPAQDNDNLLWDDTGKTFKTSRLLAGGVQE